MNNISYQFYQGGAIAIPYSNVYYDPVQFVGFTQTSLNEFSLPYLSSKYCLCEIENEESKSDAWIGQMEPIPYKSDLPMNMPGRNEGYYLSQIPTSSYTIVKNYDKINEKSERLYRCWVNDCNKILQKPWNLLDHVRMHFGIKPFQCNYWGKCFTQRGNLRKHTKQHLMPDVNQRKKYQWKHCDKSYTERYNLKVSC